MGLSKGFSFSYKKNYKYLIKFVLIFREKCVILSSLHQIGGKWRIPKRQGFVKIRWPDMPGRH